MSVDLSLYHLLANASLLVQIVILLLLVASVLSWMMIIIKARTLGAARREAMQFEDRFWSSEDLSKLYTRIYRSRKLSGMEQIFASGFKEYIRLHRQQRLSREAIADTAQRAMRVAMSREGDRLERYLSFLATVGSTSPYVGLFGTVWGIMNAFRALSDVQQATLALVAPGIAEALIATAMGLFAAIPAVIAYNRYVDDVDRLIGRYENFTDEFATLMQHQALAQEAKA